MKSMAFYFYTEVIYIVRCRPQNKIQGRKCGTRVASDRSRMRLPLKVQFHGSVTQLNSKMAQFSTAAVTSSFNKSRISTARGTLAAGGSRRHVSVSRRISNVSSSATSASTSTQFRWISDDNSDDDNSDAQQASFRCACAPHRTQADAFRPRLAAVKDTKMKNRTILFSPFIR